MDTNEFIEVQKEVENFAHYYQAIDFPIIASSFQRAANAMREMMTTIQKYECLLNEQGKEDG